MTRSAARRLLRIRDKQDRAGVAVAGFDGLSRDKAVVAHAVEGLDCAT